MEKHSNLIRADKKLENTYIVIELPQQLGKIIFVLCSIVISVIFIYFTAYPTVTTVKYFNYTTIHFPNVSYHPTVPGWPPDDDDGKKTNFNDLYACNLD